MDKAYGTSMDTILTNGPYFVKSSDPAETLLERCYDYNGNIRTMNKHIVLYTTGTEQALEERYLNGSYSMHTSRDVALENAAASYNDVWGVCFNCKSTLGSSQVLSSVLLSSINFGIIEMPSYAISKATAIIPPDFTLGDVTYSDFAPTPVKRTSDTAKAQSSLDALLTKYKKTSYTLRFAVPSEMESTARNIIKDWEKLFGEKIVIELKTFNESDAKAVATSGNYEIAILPLSPEERTPQSLLNNVNEAPCYYEKSIMQKEKALSPINEDRFNAYLSAEKALVESSIFVPLFYTGTNLYLAEDLEGIYIADGGQLIYFHGGHQIK
jgi:ABC-type oligopeptide transport system substrate-binding subunit